MKKVSCVIIIILIMVLGSISCDKFLNVVPDNTATINKAFKMRHQAQKFLYTLYHYLPVNLLEHTKNRPINPAYQTGERWYVNHTPPEILEMGEQNPLSPYFNYWDGGRSGLNYYEAIRKCNIFLKNIQNVGNMSESEKARWTAEAKFLKAYFYFYLVRMYGPIVKYSHNLSTSAPKSAIDIDRSPVDSTFNYIITLLNEAIHTSVLPDKITNRQKNLGRITKTIAYSVKAKVEVVRASPLFNGNKDYVGFENKKGISLFDTKYDPAKWDSAAAACKQAIEFVKKHNFKMFEYQPNANNASISDSIRQEMTIRGSVTKGQNSLRPNVLWSDISVPYYGAGYYRRQMFNIPRGLNRKNPSNGTAETTGGVPLKVVKMFYTNHGVPLKEDKTRNYNDRFKVKTIDKDERFYLQEGYQTAQINMHRGPRFYADLAFDGSIWYGNGIYKGGPDKYHPINARHGQVNSYSTHENSFYNPTGYWVKKLVNYRTELNSQSYGITRNHYNWANMRIAELYLLYAEAKNEANGPGPQVYKYLNKVRKHAGLLTVQESWTKWSKNPNQYKTKEGLRKIIHRETLIELAFEGKRYWELRRWKELLKLGNRPFRGWSRQFSKAKNYYHPRLLGKPELTLKDYFWPISESELNKNLNLTQNPGW